VEGAVLFGFSEKPGMNARRAANLSPEKLAVMEIVEAKYYASWDGELGHMMFGKVNPTQVLHWEIPTEEADRLLKIEFCMSSFAESPAETIWLDVKAWLRKKIGFDSPGESRCAKVGLFTAVAPAAILLRPRS
jgi:hypothetical protein